MLFVSMSLVPPILSFPEALLLLISASSYTPMTAWFGDLTLWSNICSVEKYRSHRPSTSFISGLAKRIWRWPPRRCISLCPFLKDEETPPPPVVLRAETLTDSVIGNTDQIPLLGSILAQFPGLRLRLFSFCENASMWKHHARWNKPDTKDKYCATSIQMKNLEQSNSETESRRKMAKGWGRGRAKSGFNGHQVSVWGLEKVLEMDGGVGHSTMWNCLTPLISTLRNY